jgi:pyridoxal phosphate enzyme (YggS family)
MSIADNIERLEERIINACLRCGRKREEVTLMAVTKFHGFDAAVEAWDAGIRCFGESRVQEASEKFGGCRDRFAGADLHLIGNLQRNKAKAAVSLFDCIESLDREELAKELAKHAVSRNVPVLLELHTGEESKRGFAGLDDLCRVFETVSAGSGLTVCGLMTMAPYTSDEKQVRAAFKELAKMRRELERRFPPAENGRHHWSCLTMGMSGDFEIAIEEGSTLIRIGGAIFGERA